MVIGRHRQPTVPDTSLTWCLQNLLARSEEFEEAIAQQKTQIIQLELANESLESRNLRIAKENEALSYNLASLDQLLEERDARITSLATKLEATQDEVNRLTVLVSKTQELEEQLKRMDIERSLLQDTLAETEGETRKAKAARRKSERDYRELEKRLENIEIEAQLERSNHPDGFTCIGFRTPSEKETGRRSPSPNTDAKRSGEGMSNFVNQILEENSTLHVNVSELEALLRQTRDEMEDLRGQMLNAIARDDYESRVATHTPKTLNQELVLGLVEPRAVASSEVHVHHHYHDPSASCDRDSLSRSRTVRPKKRRPVLLSNSRATSAYYHRPSSRAFSSSSPGSESPLDSKRWSSFSGGAHSTFTASTIPSSSPPTSISSHFDNFKAVPPLSPLEDYDLPTPPLPADPGAQDPLLLPSIPLLKESSYRPLLKTALSAKQNTHPVLSSATAQAQSSTTQNENATSGSTYLRNQQDALNKRQSAPPKEGYAPVRDTFGWFKSKLGNGASQPKAMPAPKRNTAKVSKPARVEGAVVDEAALAECLGEEVACD